MFKYLNTNNLLIYILIFSTTHLYGDEGELSLNLLEQTKLAVAAANQSTEVSINNDINTFATEINKLSSLLSSRINELSEQVHLASVDFQSFINDYSSIITDANASKKYTSDNYIKLIKLQTQYEQMVANYPLISSEYLDLRKNLQQIKNANENLVNNYQESLTNDQLFDFDSYLSQNEIKFHKQYSMLDFKKGWYKQLSTSSTDDQANTTAVHAAKLAGEGIIAVGGMLMSFSVIPPLFIAGAVVSAVGAITSYVTYHIVAKSETDELYAIRKKGIKLIQEQVTVQINESAACFQESLWNNAQKLVKLNEIAYSENSLTQKNKEIVEQMNNQLEELSQTMDDLHKNMTISMTSSSLKTALLSFKDEVIKWESQESLKEYHATIDDNYKIYKAAKHWNESIPKLNLEHAQYTVAHAGENCGNIYTKVDETVIQLNLYKTYILGFKTDKNQADSFFNYLESATKDIEKNYLTAKETCEEDVDWLNESDDNVLPIVL